MAQSNPFGEVSAMAKEEADILRGSPGVAVDSRGGAVIDPTKNVLDLVQAESRYQDGMRRALADYQKGMLEASEKFQALMVSSSAALRDAELRLQNWMREAETKRVDQLADLRQVYETRIADMLSASVQSTSSLVSTQLVQIQATFDARVSKLEQFRWESGGRSSVADPALADAMSSMAAAILALKTTQAAGLDAMATNVAALKTTETATVNRGVGRGEVVAWVAAGVAAIASLGTIAGLMLKSAGH